jgi:acetylornithine deacetylase/succinyl-diaminopimelate desuccinylase-like protein
MRIPPGQDGKKALAALVAHLREHAPWGAEVTISHESSGEPFVTKTGGRAYKAMKAALAKAWGHKAVDIGAGGTIPFLFDLAELFPNAEIMVTGVEDPRSGAHGPDESLDLGELERACLAEALFLTRLAVK